MKLKYKILQCKSILKDLIKQLLMIHSNRQKEKQCPLCYQQTSIIRKVCQSSHKICQKCLFKLRKRQCPICKKNFKIKIKNNGHSYDILFNQKDRQHDNKAKQQDFQQQQQSLREYYNNQQNHNRNHNYSQQHDNSSQQQYMLQNHQAFQSLRFVDQLEYIQNIQIMNESQFEFYMRDQNWRQDQNQIYSILTSNRNRQVQTAQKIPSEVKTCSVMGTISQFFNIIGQRLNGNSTNKKNKREIQIRQQYQINQNRRDLRDSRQIIRQLNNNQENYNPQQNLNNHYPYRHQYVRYTCANNPNHWNFYPQHNFSHHYPHMYINGSTNQGQVQYSNIPQMQTHNQYHTNLQNSYTHTHTQANNHIPSLYPNHIHGLHSNQCSNNYHAH